MSCVKEKDILTLAEVARKLYSTVLIGVKTIAIGKREMKLNFKYKNKWGFF